MQISCTTNLLPELELQIEIVWKSNTSFRDLKHNTTSLCAIIAAAHETGIA